MNENTIDICKELHQNAIDFAYEANSQRAFADARDGLKPGQRACLWEMYTRGYTSNKPHVKSAKIDGGVAATWWPHGTTAIYETFARMSQDWINNIPEVDWHGANGNQIIGSTPAADRYTEARLAKATEDGMLVGLKKNNVPMVLNFSEDEEWPEVLPAVFPRLLVNGCQGIGYTVANVWVTHNLKEITEVIKKYLSTNEIDYNNIYPDFPSGGIITNKNDLSTIYKTGKGPVHLRGRATIDKKSILITELPYQTYVEPLLEEIKDLILKEEIQGIKEVYNKCDKKKLLIEIECESNPNNILAQLYQLTSLQKTFSVNQYALVSKTPKLLTLKDYLDIYIQHNIQCIKREYMFDLAKAKARAEIVEGLIKALENIDNIIELIKKSESASAAKETLIKKYEFTENQAKAILDMKLAKLARLEKIELNNELIDLTSNIKLYAEIIESNDKLQEKFIERLTEFTNKYGQPRKTEIMQISITSKSEDKEIRNVEPEKCVVTMTESGLIKRIPSSNFKIQKRNGKGVKTQDDITHVVIRTNTIDSLMIFTNKGKVYRLLVNDIPEGTNSTKGVAVTSLVEMESDEKPSTIYSLYRGTEAKYVFFATKKGIVKKTSLEEFSKLKKKGGLAAIGFKTADDSLAAASLINEESIILITKKGLCLRFDSTTVGALGRTATGVKGITLSEGDEIIAALPVRDKTDRLAIFLANGSGKKIDLTEIPIQNRGGKGLVCCKTGTAVAAASLIAEDDTILIIGEKSSICISASDIPATSRGATGNQLLSHGVITSVSKV